MHKSNTKLVKQSVSHKMEMLQSMHKFPNLLKRMVMVIMMQIPILLTLKIHLHKLIILVMLHKEMIKHLLKLIILVMLQLEMIKHLLKLIILVMFQLEMIKHLLKLIILVMLQLEMMFYKAAT